MLKNVKGWLKKSHQQGANSALPTRPTSSPLVPAAEEDIEGFLTAVTQANKQGNSPWIMRDDNAIATLRRALEYTVHRGVWLQPINGSVAHWQGRLLALKLSEDPPVGMVLLCRADEEAAWQLRFFYIQHERQGSQYGARLLTATRATLNGEPLQTRVPLACHAAIKTLEAAGFERRHVDAYDVAIYEATAAWN